MKKTLNVGVIGLGRAGEKHAEMYYKLPFVNLVAVCDRDESKLSNCCKNFGCRGYIDYKELLADSSIDAVSIVMPDTLHYDVTKIALENNKHILLEKPIAATLDEGRRIQKLANESDKVFMVAHILRYMPQNNLAQQSIENGEIGEIIHLMARRNSMITGAYAYRSHNTDTHIHLMVHDIDYINWIVKSKPVKVYAKSRQVLLKELNMRDTIIAMIEYANGVIATIEACWIMPGNSPRELDDRIEIVGTKGILYLEGICSGIQLVSAEKVMNHDTGAWPKINDSYGGSIFEEVTAFVNYIIRGEKPLVGADEAMEALVLADAIDRSARENREILL